VFINRHLVESQMFHGGRLADYPAGLAAVITQYVDDGWIADDVPSPSPH
jgi:hypothetical protein